MTTADFEDDDLMDFVLSHRIEIELKANQMIQDKGSYLDFTEAVIGTAINLYMERIAIPFAQQNIDDPVMQRFIRRAFDPPREDVDLFGSDS